MLRGEVFWSRDQAITSLEKWVTFRLSGAIGRL